MAPHPLLPSGVVEPPHTGAEKLLSPLAIADARGLADWHNFLVLGGSTISDGKGGWGATRGYPRLTPRHPANRLFEIALLDAI